MLLFYLSLPVVVVVTVYYSVASLIGMRFDPSFALFFSQMRKWARVLLRLFRIKVRARGTERIDPARKYVYVANHSSYIDILALLAAVPDDLRFVFKEELAKIPIFGYALRVGPNIIINRADPREAMGSIEHAAEQIRTGRGSVVIFPEGTRTVDGTLGEFKRGGFLLATRAGVPIVPVAIKGTQRLLPKDEWRVRQGEAEVIIGTPIDVPADVDRPRERAIQEETRMQLQEMLARPADDR